LELLAAAEKGHPITAVEALQVFATNPYFRYPRYRTSFIYLTAAACHRAGEPAWQGADLSRFQVPVVRSPYDAAQVAIIDGVLAIHSADRPRAERAVETLRSIPDSWVCVFPDVVPVFAGELLVFLDDHDRAIEQLKRGVEICEGAGWNPDLARAKFWWSEALISRGSQSDLPLAGKLQEEALALAQRLGMTPLVERIVARRKILKA
jgi:hypothetical protein